MSDETAVSVERRPPEEVFGLLSNDVRVEIVQTLGEADDPLSFSALHAATSADDSGKFNYHLRKLVGHFVTQSEEGYRLSFAGEQVYGAILSGAYTANASVPPFEFDGPCPACGHETLVAEYGDEMARLSCQNCDRWRNEFPFPPGTLDQFPRRDLPVAFDRWMRATVTRFLQGFCGNCGGRVDSTLQPTPDDGSRPVRAVFECGRCGDELRASPLLPVLSHPVAVSFFERRGVDVLHDPSWRYYDESAELSVDLLDDQPTARVVLAADGASLVATIDAEVTITEVTVE